MQRQPFSFGSFLAGAIASAATYAVFKYVKEGKIIKTDGGDNEPSENNNAVAKAESYCWKLVEHSFTGALIFVMDDLGLFSTLADTGPISVKELSLQTGYSERWLRELLAQSAGAGICEYDSKKQKFCLRPEYAKLLLPPEKERKSLTGMFRLLRGLMSGRPEATIRAVKTGIGVDYDFGDAIIDSIDQKNRNFFRYNLIPDIIQKVTIPSSSSTSGHIKLYDLLLKGVNVADIGCGCGTSTMTLAQEFPKSHFYAYEASSKSLVILEKRIQEAGITNITTCNVASRRLSDGPNNNNTREYDEFGSERNNNKFDFVYSHDLLHDMTDPRSLIREVKAQLAKDGCWVVVDIKCSESMATNLAMPCSALNFGFSCLLCLSCATSSRNGRGEGLGTMGFHSKLAEKWMREAGFEHFAELEIDSKPDNSCFIVA